MLEAGEASAVVVYDLDRFSRYVPDYYLLVDRVLNPRRIRLADSTTGWVDTVTPTGRAAFGMKAVLSQFVREQTSQATRDTLRHKISEGEWVGRPPYGFAAPPEDRTKLVPLEAELKLNLARAGADPARCRTTGYRPSSKLRV